MKKANIAFIVFIISILLLIGWSMLKPDIVDENVNQEYLNPASTVAPKGFEETIALVNEYIDNEDYAAAKELLEQLKATNTDKELVYTTYGRLYSKQKQYHSAKSILLEGKQKAKTIMDINEQLGIVDEKIENGESID